MSKKDRKKIFEKYGGKCAYCGCELGKGWHVSPIQPLQITIGEDGQFGEANNDEANMMPSCAGCSLSKMHLGMNGKSGMLTLENFRKAIERSFEHFKDYPQYKRAVRFGQIKEVSPKVKFYFETINPPPVDRL
jgi:hypothetical protein